VVPLAIPQRRAPRSFLLLALVGCLTLAAGVTLWLLAFGPSGGSADRGPVSEAARAAFAEETGVQVVRVALTGGGGIVDLRYQVIDPNKAQVVHDDTPVLVDEETNEVIDTFFMGHRHSGRNRPKAGVTYPLLYVNERGLIEQGRTVSVVIGDSRLQHVAVR
jgi:hypothetical protein